ncbi:MAG: hypothetical protein MRY32_03820 [Rickettsiales bacterium]|nr:hypothetical protein [Rickettsiales bacterium]
MAEDNDFIVGAGTQEYDELLEELSARFDKKPSPLPHHEAARSVRHVSGVGKFIIPKENTWAAHRMLVLDPKLKLGYSANNHPYFDHIVSEKAKYKPLTNQGDARYPAYDSMRENLAIVRNFIMSDYFPDGSVDANDEAKLRHMAQIAHFVGDAIANDGMFPNPFKPRISKRKANMPGTGAQYIYKQLLKRQNYNSWLSPITFPLAILTGRTHNIWDLPPLDESPFSDYALQQPPPKMQRTYNEDEIPEVCDTMAKNDRMPQDMSAQYAEGINHLSEDLTHAGHMHGNVDHLQEPTKRESVEIAKEILRKLKVKLGNALIANGLTPFPADNMSILDAVKGVVQVYEYHLHKLTAFDPNIMENPAIIQTNNAIGKLGYIGKVEALRMAQRGKDPQAAQAIHDQLMQMPDEWHNPKEERIGELLEQLENGLNLVLTRLQHLGEPDASVQNWMGRQNHKAIGTIDPAFEKRDNNNPQQSMQDDDYFRQVNAQRQQAMRAAARKQKQQLERDVTNKAASNAPKPKECENKSTDMSSLLKGSDVESMRGQMQTDPNAQIVKAQNESRRQAVVARERSRREQQQKSNQIKIKENLNRLHDDPNQMPLPKKPQGPMTR